MGINSFIHIISVTQSQDTTTLSSFLGMLVILAGFLLVHEAVLGPGAVQPEIDEVFLAQITNNLWIVDTGFPKPVRVRLKTILFEEQMPSAFGVLDHCRDVNKALVLYINAFILQSPNKLHLQQ